MAMRPMKSLSWLNSTTPTFANVTDEMKIGGLGYFLIYMSDYLPYVILSSLGTVFGIFGNILIISAVICTKELHSPTNILVFNLALADLVISGFVDSFTVIGVFMGKTYFDERPVLCQFIGAVCLIACETSLVSIGFLAVNRYVNICCHQYYKKIFTVKKTLIYCGITWVIGVLIDIPNITGWGGHFYDPKTLNCVWDRLASQSYSIFFPMSSIITPCVIILICYMRIFLFAYGAKNKVTASSAEATITTVATNQINKQTVENQATGIKHKEQKKDQKGPSNGHHKHHIDISRSLRIAKGLFASFMLFTLCWLPYGMIVMTDYADRLPRSAHMFSMEIAHLNSSLNPLLYAIFNPAFQRGYMTVFRTILGRKKLNEKRSNASQVGVGTDFTKNAQGKFKVTSNFGQPSCVSYRAESGHRGQ